MSINTIQKKGVKTLALILVIFLIGGRLSAQESNQDGSPADSTALPDEGFIGDGDSEIDYDALIKELYGKEEPTEVTADSISSEPTRKKRRARQKPTGPAPGLFKRSALNGSHVAFSAASPYMTAKSFYSWYSYIDASATLKLPFEFYVESLPLYLLFEISSFRFENSYPEGGEFTGLAYIIQVSSIGDNAGAALGFGSWDGTLGSMVEANYRFRPTRNSFFRLGTRGVLITNVEPIGPVWWTELRVSMGIEL